MYHTITSEMWGTNNGDGGVVVIPQTRGRSRVVSDNAKTRVILEDGLRELTQRIEIAERMFQVQMTISTENRDDFSTRSARGLIERRGDHTPRLVKKRQLGAEKERAKKPLFDVLPTELSDICFRMDEKYHQLVLPTPLLRDRDRTPIAGIRARQAERRWDAPKITRIQIPTKSDPPASPEDDASSLANSLFSRIPSTSSCDSFYSTGTGKEDSKIGEGGPKSLATTSSFSSAVDYPYRGACSSPSCVESADSVKMLNAVVSSSECGSTVVRLQDSPLWTPFDLVDSMEVMTATSLEARPNSNQDDHRTVTVSDSPNESQATILSRRFLSKLSSFRSLINTHAALISSGLEGFSEANDAYPHETTRLADSQQEPEIELQPVTLSSHRFTGPLYNPLSLISIPPSVFYPPILPEVRSPPRVPLLFSQQKATCSMDALEGPCARLRVVTDSLYYLRLAVLNRTRIVNYQREKLNKTRGVGMRVSFAAAVVGGGSGTVGPSKNVGAVIAANRKKQFEEERVRRGILSPKPLRAVVLGSGETRVTELEEDKVLGVCLVGRESGLR